jgi:hypothetical protein
MGIINKIHFNEKIPAGELYILLEVDLTKNIPDALIFNHSSIQWGLHLLNDLKLNYNWDEDEFFIIIGELEVSLYDRLGNLKTSLASDNFKELRLKVTINGNILFSGYNYGEYVVDDKNRYKFKFSHFLNKLSEIPVSINGQFNYQFSPNKYNINSYNVYNLLELIHDFYLLVDEGIDLTVYNNWIFWSAYYNSTRYSCDFSQLLVIFRYIFINETGSSPMFAFQTYMEALKALLLSLGLWGGLLRSDLAFVSSFFKPNETQSGEVLELKINKIRSNYDYVKITTGNFIWADIGQESSIEEKNKEIMVRGSIFKVPYDTPITMSYIQENPSMPIIDYGKFIASIFGNFYLKKYQWEADIILNGIDYVPYKAFLINNNSCIIKEMEMDLIANKTTIKGLLI